MPQCSLPCRQPRAREIPDEAPERIDTRHADFREAKILIENAIIQGAASKLLIGRHR